MKTTQKMKLKIPEWKNIITNQIVVVNWNTGCLDRGRQGKLGRGLVVRL